MCSSRVFNPLPTKPIPPAIYLPSRVSFVTLSRESSANLCFGGVSDHEYRLPPAHKMCTDLLTHLVLAGNAKRGVPAISEGGDKIDIKLKVDNDKVTFEFEVPLKPQNLGI